MKDINEGTWYHAHPNYDNGQPWQDWAMVSFGTNSARMPKKVAPIKTVAILQNQSTDAQGNATNEIRAIVQTCDYHVGTAKCGQQQIMEETHLCSHWQISMKHVSQQGLRVNIPELYAIHSEDIHESVFGVQREAGSL
jgi:hypothetical protein